MRVVFAARSARAFAYGLAAVDIGLALGAAGFDATAVGVLLSLALGTGAAYSWSAGVIARRWGIRTTLMAGACVMIVSGLLMGTGLMLAMIGGIILGTISAGTQEVGPFSALEQAAIADVHGIASAGPFARYNLFGGFALALGALAAAVIPLHSSMLVYAAVGVVLLVLYAAIPPLEPPPARAADNAPLSPLVMRLTALYGADALAGGLVIQSFIAYWLHARFGIGTAILGPLFFAVNMLNALSYLGAEIIAARIGLLNTMVLTHLPSNIMLALVPLVPNFPAAAGLLLVRSLLSNMDTPARQAYTMAVVAPSERLHAASLTSGVRPAAAAVAPMIAGSAIQFAALGLPFVLAGTIKATYDIALFAIFRRVRLSE